MTGANLRAAVIGCGHVGRLHAQAIDRSEHAKLVAVCDIDRTRSGSLARHYGVEQYSSVEELLSAESLELVTVATPDVQHVAPTLSAIARGIHVFCEKPLATSSSDIEAIAQAARAESVYVGVDYNRRFGFGYAKAMSICRQAPPSGLRQIAVHVVDGIPEQVAMQPYALLTSLATHHLDLLRWFAGDVVSIQSTFGGPVFDRPHHAVLTLEHRSGALSSLIVDWRAGQARTVEQMRIVSDTRIITIDDVQREVEVWTNDPDKIEIYRPSPFEAGNRFYDTVIENVLAFAEGLFRDGSIHNDAATVEDAVATTKMIDAAIESARSGQRIAVVTGSQENQQ